MGPKYQEIVRNTLEMVEMGNTWDRYSPSGKPLGLFPKNIVEVKN